jgi:hypothetical protein
MFKEPPSESTVPCRLRANAFPASRNDGATQKPTLPYGVTVIIQVEDTNEDRSRSNITCFRCGENGHFRSECHVYRVQMCEKLLCKNSNCHSAHSVAELRTPWKPKCVRVVKNGGVVKKLGCGQTGHTYRNCPYASSSNVA